jgi:hypothetical protein
MSVEDYGSRQGSPLRSAMKQNSIERAAALSQPGSPLRISSMDRSASSSISASSSKKPKGTLEKWASKITGKLSGKS